MLSKKQKKRNIINVLKTSFEIIVIKQTRYECLSKKKKNKIKEAKNQNESIEKYLGILNGNKYK